MTPSQAKTQWIGLSLRIDESMNQAAQKARESGRYEEVVEVRFFVDGQELRMSFEELKARLLATPTLPPGIYRVEDFGAVSDEAAAKTKEQNECQQAEINSIQQVSTSQSSDSPSLNTPVPSSSPLTPAQ